MVWLSGEAILRASSKAAWPIREGAHSEAVTARCTPCGRVWRSAPPSVCPLCDRPTVLRADPGGDQLCRAPDHPHQVTGPLTPSGVPGPEPPSSSDGDAPPSDGPSPELQAAMTATPAGRALLGVEATVEPSPRPRVARRRPEPAPDVREREARLLAAIRGG